MKKTWKLISLIVVSAVMGWGGAVVIALIGGFPLEKNMDIVIGGLLATLLLALSIISYAVVEGEL